LPSVPTAGQSERGPGPADETVARFLEHHAHESAVTVITWGQIVRLILWGMLLVAAILYWAHEVRDPYYIITRVLCVFYVAVILYKLLVVFLSVFHPQEVRVSDEEIARTAAEELPMYTILVPLYHEDRVADNIIQALDALDYPSDRLDVILLLEEDDEATIRACREAGLPACYQMLIVPHSLPKTKPKACNHGLRAARGDLLVIYDAEDRPEPDQLLKAVAAFNKAPPKVACLQAKLNYYNPRQNMLTKWFTVEYTTWFDLFLPGLNALGVPIPLGGTSNHFKTAVLRDVGGWDPFNVTEDCDLGIRLHRRGYRTRVLDTTTWEEANSRLGNWIRQRSRWVKGYIQTHFVHTRHPLRTWWECGTFGYISFLLSVGGLSLMLLLNPIFWAVGILYLFLRWRMIYPELPFSYLFWGMSVALALGNVVFVMLHVLACTRRHLAGLLPYAITTPIYWVLISIGAWKGFLQLLWRPFYWEKTVHGLTVPERKSGVRERAAATPADGHGPSR